VGLWYTMRAQRDVGLLYTSVQDGEVAIAFGLQVELNALMDAV
jgi:hypothetical protein